MTILDELLSIGICKDVSKWIILAYLFKSKEMKDYDKTINRLKHKFWYQQYDPQYIINNNNIYDINEHVEWITVILGWNKSDYDDVFRSLY